TAMDPQRVQTQAVRDTIVSPDSQGWTLRGAGTCGVMDASPWATAISGEHATVLRWAGAADGPMLHARGAHWLVSDMALTGWETLDAKRDAADAPACGTGVFVRHVGRFNGSKGVIERVGFAGFEAAIRIGQPGDHGNDNLTLRNVAFAHCGSAIRVEAAQAMSTRVTGMHAKFTPVIVDAAGGGDVAVRDLETDDRATLLVVRKDNRGIGVNNSAFRFETIKADRSGDDRTYTLVDQQRVSSLRATVVDLRLPSDKGRRLRATLRGRDSSLTIVDAKNLPRATRFELHRGATVTIRDSVLLADPQKLISEQSTQGTVLVRDCWRHGKPVNDLVSVGGD
ncbi:MAG: hypothetical protein AAF805_12890, partial [Planctomycetota bacterium]